MKLLEIIDTIESFAPLCAAAPWDASGMQVACATQDIDHIAICLDPTPQAIQAAVDMGAGFIVSHHPLLLKPRLPARHDRYYEVLRLLLRHDAGLYAAHTSLDANPLASEAPAAWLADELGLTERVLLETTCTHTDTGQHYGFGIVGNLPEAINPGPLVPPPVSPVPLVPPALFTPADLLHLLRRWLPLDTARHCGPMPTEIRRVALCMGSGASLIGAAYTHGADVYITGDIKYHDALEAPLWIIDVGHHALEEEMMRRFARTLAQNLTQTLAQILPVPVTYIYSQTPFRGVHCPA